MKKEKRGELLKIFSIYAEDLLQMSSSYVNRLLDWEFASHNFGFSFFQNSWTIYDVYFGDSLTELGKNWGMDVTSN